MRKAIITAIRYHPQVKGSLKFTALELAYRSNDAGYVEMSYSYLALRTGYHLRTIIRHIARLEELDILRKYVRRTARDRCEINLYVFLCVTRTHREETHLKNWTYEGFRDTRLWKTLRFAALRRANHRCSVCSTQVDLEVHHRTYERFGGKERPEDLIVLCRDCHGLFHKEGRLAEWKG